MEGPWPSSPWREQRNSDRAGEVVNARYLEYQPGHAYQKAICQPVVQNEHGGRSDTEWFVTDRPLVSNRSWRNYLVGTGAGELSVIDEGEGLNIEVQRDVYRHKCECGGGVSHESPLDAPPCTIDWIEQRVHTLEE